MCFWRGLLSRCLLGGSSLATVVVELRTGLCLLLGSVSLRLRHDPNNLVVTIVGVVTEPAEVEAVEMGLCCWLLYGGYMI